MFRTVVIGVGVYATNKNKASTFGQNSELVPAIMVGAGDSNGHTPAIAGVERRRSDQVCVDQRHESAPKDACPILGCCRAECSDR